jgi:exodeoxyribonuclease V alpha subunit
MEVLTGVVERVTFYSADTGYSVLRLQPTPTPATGQAYPLRALSNDGLVTVVGNLPEVNPGESLRLRGGWIHHGDYGYQFKAEQAEQVLPATVLGIQRYLGSGLIKGIGPVMAERIVQQFGLDTLRVIEHEPQKLRLVVGMGGQRVKEISKAWQEQKAIKDVMLFLQGHGVSSSLAVKIYKQYGDQAVAVVQANPYQLARDVWGIGFKTADKIAQHLGLPADAPTRIQAGVTYALQSFVDEGHVYAPVAELQAKASELLGVSTDQIPPALQALQAQQQIQCPPPSGALPIAAGSPLQLKEDQAVYLTPFYYGEVGVSNRLRRLVNTPSSGLARLRAASQTIPIEKLFPTSTLKLSSEQQTALMQVLQAKVAVLTGGPGTGKTTCLKALITLLQAYNCRFALASPTGRAAKRLSEATGQPAQTLHRLLQYQPPNTFVYNEHNLLELDLLVVDEASMIDLLLFNHLLKALPPSIHLLLVGDTDQLPAVGAGDVLRDVIDSGIASVARLTTIFRQAQDSGIISNAHRLNQGELPIFAKDSTDFFLFPFEEPSDVAKWVVEIVQQRAPQKFGIPSSQIQVLTPMYRGEVGVVALNAQLQAALNPASPKTAERHIAGTLFRVGDRVMQVRNNYDKDVYNGDIGTLQAIHGESTSLTVNFAGHLVRYDWQETDELTHAFAISVHKAQGSEYPVVVLPLVTQHYLLLQRNLLYTAITRAKRACIIIGSWRAIRLAVQNNKVSERYSGLAERLAPYGTGPATQPEVAPPA